MICPIDQTQLVITERQGIEIDYCPKCRGVWLDRGELDKIIERGGNGFNQPAPRQEYREEAPRREHRDYDDDDDHRRHTGSHGDGRHHKKESFLGDLFDF